MHQHKQRYFHARHRRPSPAIKWHHAARVRIRFPATWARQGTHARPRPGQRRRQEAVPAEGHGPRAAGLAARPAVRGRRHGLTAASRELGQHQPRPGSGAYHTAPCCGRRCAAMLATIASATPCADPSPTPAMILGGSAAKTPAHPARQLPSRTPCSRNRAEPRKGAERRAGIRNLRPFRIPVHGSPSERTRKSGLRRRLPTATCGSTSIAISGLPEPRSCMPSYGLSCAHCQGVRTAKPFVPDFLPPVRHRLSSSHTPEPWG